MIQFYGESTIYSTNSAILYANARFYRRNGFANLINLKCLLASKICLFAHLFCRLFLLVSPLYHQKTNAVFEGLKIIKKYFSFN